MSRLRALLRFPYLWLWLGPLLLFAPVYLTGRAMFWGTPLLQFVPWWAFAWETLLDGHLPLWNPYVGMGAPLLANYQSALLYPPTWVYFGLYLLGGVRLMAWGQALLAALHLAWAALGMAWLARRLGLGTLAQVVAGLAYGMSGYLVARSGFLSINAAAAWLPWVILSLTNYVVTTSIVSSSDPQRLKSLLQKTRPFLALVVCVAMQLLSGHAQTTWYTLTLAGLWVIFWSWYSIPPAAGARRLRAVAAGLLGLALAGALAAGLAAAQLLPTGEYLAQSQRSSAVEYEFALNYSFWPWHVLTLLAPGLFGSPASGDHWGFSNYWEDAVYVGLLPLLLAIAALAGGLRLARKPKETRLALPPGRRPGLMAFLLALILTALLLALGRFTPVFPWLYRHVPTFAMFQAPARWMIWSEFALALLAGAGADAWRRPRRRSLYWTRLGTMGAFAITLGAGAGWLLLGDVSPTFVRAAALLGLWSLGAGLLSLAAPESDGPLPPERPPSGLAARWFPSRAGPKAKKPPARSFPPPVPLRFWHIGVAGWIALDLLVAGWGLNPAGPLELYDPSPDAEQVRQMAGGGRLFIPPGQEDWLKYVRFLRFRSFDPGEDWLNLRGVNLPNANMLDHLPVANQFDPLVPARYSAWLELLAAAPADVYPQLVRRMDVGVVQTIHRHAPNGIRLAPVERSGRAGVAGCVRWASNLEEAGGLLVNGGLDLERELVIEPAAGFSFETEECTPDWTRDDRGQVEVVVDDSRNPNRLELRVKSRDGGWLWVADTYYPGWQASVDGRPVAIQIANAAFRALPVPAGEHSVALVYRPRSFYTGVLISLLSLGLFAGLFIWQQARREAPAV